MKRRAEFSRHAYALEMPPPLATRIPAVVDTVLFEPHPQHTLPSAVPQYARYREPSLWGRNWGPGVFEGPNFGIPPQAQQNFLAYLNQAIEMLGRDAARVGRERTAVRRLANETALFEVEDPDALTSSLTMGMTYRDPATGMLTPGSSHRPIEPTILPTTNEQIIAAINAYEAIRTRLGDDARSAPPAAVAFGTWVRMVGPNGWIQPDRVTDPDSLARSAETCDRTLPANDPLRLAIDQWAREYHPTPTLLGRPMADYPSFQQTDVAFIAPYRYEMLAAFARDQVARIIPQVGPSTPRPRVQAPWVAGTSVGQAIAASQDDWSDILTILGALFLGVHVVPKALKRRR